MAYFLMTSILNFLSSVSLSLQSFMRLSQTTWKMSAPVCSSFLQLSCGLAAAEEYRYSGKVG